jgi:hypothetical protein
MTADVENTLAVYDKMVFAIDQCYKVDEVKDIRDKALALEEYARQACNIKAERKAAEIRIRAERKAGKLLAEIEKSKGGRPKTVEKNSLHHEASFVADQKETPYQQAKREAHISDTQADRWQQLAAMPHGDFEGRLHDPLVIPTTSGILDADRPKAAPSDALWLWGRIRDLEREGYLSKDINEIVHRMSAKMQEEMRRLLPQTQNWINNYHG